MAVISRKISFSSGLLAGKRSARVPESMVKYESVIGLEIHVALLTKVSSSAAVRLNLERHLILIAVPSAWVYLVPAYS